MTLRTRLVLSIAGIAALLSGPAIYALSRLRAVNEIADQQRNRHGLALQAIGGLQTELAELELLVREYVGLSEPEGRRQMWASMDSIDAKLRDLRTAGYDSAAAPTRGNIAVLRSTIVNIDSLMLAGEKELATTNLEQVKPFISGMYASSLAQITAEIHKSSQADLEQAISISRNATGTTLLVLLICGALAAALGVWTTRHMSRPITRLEAATARVANGEFRVPGDLPYTRNDEIGSVARSFRSMTRRLAELDRMKAEFLSIATHELKTPLNVVSGYAELMQERVYGDLNERQDEALTAIRDQIRSLAQLVSQLLDISRFEAGGLRLQMQEMVMTDLFDRIARSFGPLAQKNDIHFTVEQDPTLPATIVGDADRLRDQVLGNLLSNAFKFTPSGGRVSVRVWPEAEIVIVEVSDTGPGIPADQLPQIFDKFFQVGDQARSKGAGLGLAIAREVIEAHGGRIHVESEPGVGTTFRIQLPVISSDVAALAGITD
jgi:signal transduction histidine kinase